MRDPNDVSASELLDLWIENSPGAVMRISLGKSEEMCTSEMKLTGKSVLGTILRNYGGIICCAGHVRHFGGANRHCASLFEINTVKDGFPTLLSGLLVVAEDSGGGIFGINCGFNKVYPNGSLFYLPQDSYQWEAMEIGHADFVRWTLCMTRNKWKEYGWGCGREPFTDLRKADLMLKGRVCTYIAL